MKRLAVIGIVLEGDRSASAEVQSILAQYGDIIVGRMGVPMREDGLNAISVIVKGENEQISALTGKLGRLDEVTVKSAVTSKEIKD